MVFSNNIVTCNIVRTRLGGGRRATPMVTQNLQLLRMVGSHNENLAGDHDLRYIGKLDVCHQGECLVRVRVLDLLAQQVSLHSSQMPP